MRLAVLAALLAASCAHPDGAAIREEQAKARRYRDAYEAQVLEIAQLKGRIAELEQRCRR